VKFKVSLAAVLALSLATVFWLRGCGFATFCLSGGDVPSRVPAVVPEGAVENDPRLEGRVGANPRLAENLVGEWRSSEDSSFTRVFSADKTFHDTYAGDPAGAPGTWEVSAGKADQIQLSSEGDTMTFDVVSLTENDLSMIYLGRGNLLRFERVR
jgi:hypothetical protein